MSEKTFPLRLDINMGFHTVGDHLYVPKEGAKHIYGSRMLVINDQGIEGKSGLGIAMLLGDDDIDNAAKMAFVISALVQSLANFTVMCDLDYEDVATPGPQRLRRSQLRGGYRDIQPRKTTQRPDPSQPRARGALPENSAFTPPLARPNGPACITPGIRHHDGR